MHTHTHTHTNRSNKEPYAPTPNLASNAANHTEAHNCLRKHLHQNTRAALLSTRYTPRVLKHPCQNRWHVHFSHL